MSIACWYKLIAPMPEDQVAEKTIRHRLATWYAHQLPEDHPLLKYSRRAVGRGCFTTTRRYSPREWACRGVCGEA
jgi:hypothetical protein